MKKFNLMIMGYKTAMKFVAGHGKDGSLEKQNDYVTVTQGEWEFEIIKNGDTLLHFADGKLKQNGGYIWYDDAGFFKGSIKGTFWSGTNLFNEFDFEGNFKGPVQDKFEGVITFRTDNAKYDLYGFRVN